MEACACVWQAAVHWPVPARPPRRSRARGSTSWVTMSLEKSGSLKSASTGSTIAGGPSGVIAIRFPQRVRATIFPSLIRRFARMQHHLLSGPVHLVAHAIGDMHRLLFGNLHQVCPLKIKSLEFPRHHGIVLHGLPQFFDARDSAGNHRIQVGWTAGPTRDESRIFLTRQTRGNQPGSGRSDWASKMRTANSKPVAGQTAT